MRLFVQLLAFSIGFFVASCAVTRRGGSDVDIPNGPKVHTITPSNPNTPTTNVVKRTVTRTYFDPIPANETDAPATVSQRTGNQVKREVVSTETPTPLLKSETVVDEVNTTISGSWFDQMKTKLGALKPVMYVGIFLMLAAAAMFVPAVYAFVGSRTTQLMVGLVGLGMTILPTLIVGQENLILIIGVLAVAVYVFAHRHGELKGTVKALTSDVKKL